MQKVLNEPHGLDVDAIKKQMENMGFTINKVHDTGVDLAIDLQLLVQKNSRLNPVHQEFNLVFLQSQDSIVLNPVMSFDKYALKYFGTYDVDKFLKWLRVKSMELKIGNDDVLFEPR